MTYLRIVRRSGLFLALFSLLFSVPSSFAETIELVTYYPAPGGGNVDTPRLHAGRATVGNPYSLTNPADANLPNGTLLVANRLGIGTANPQMDLEVYRKDESYIRVWGTGINATPENFAGIELGSDLPADGVIDQIWQLAHKRGGAGGLNDFQISHRDALGNWTHPVAIQPGGNVGIGRTAPASRLQIQGENTTNATSGLNVTNSLGGSLLFVRNDGSVGIETDNPRASSVLELTSTTRGFFPPRMTTLQRDATLTPTLTAADEGLTIYNLDAHQLQFWNGTEWDVPPGGGGGHLATGTYTANGSSSTSTTTQTINVGFKPKVIYLYAHDAPYAWYYVKHDTMTGSNGFSSMPLTALMSSADLFWGNIGVTITSTGFTVQGFANYSSGVTYHYAASG